METGKENEVKTEHWVTRNGKWVVTVLALVVLLVAIVQLNEGRGYVTIDGTLKEYTIENDVLVADVGDDTMVIPIDMIKFKKGNSGVNKLKFEVKGKDSETMYRNVTWYVNKENEDSVRTNYELKTGSKLILK